jgi:hypothetical protein
MRGKHRPTPAKYCHTERIWPKIVKVGAEKVERYQLIMQPSARLQRAYEMAVAGVVT